MKLKYKLVNQFLGALLNLNGRNRVIESDGKPSSSVFEPYAFPQQARVNIIRNIALLRPLHEGYLEAQKVIIQRLSPDGTPHAIDGSPTLSKMYREEHGELLESKVEAKGLLLINWSDLNSAKVDPVTVANLGALVRGLPAADDADLVPDEEEKKS